MLKNFGTSMEIKDPKEGYFFGISFEGQEIFKNAVKTMARLAEEALEEAELSVDDFDLCIPHQANLRILEATAKRCNFPMEKMVINLDRYGNTSFGRSCLVATQLVQAGVRCVEVTLGGWDTHINKPEAQRDRIRILDPAMAAMMADLKASGLLENTIVIWAGEFGRTPQLNGASGRDHWPHGFSVVMGGGGIRGGQVVGETNKTPDIRAENKTRDVVNPVTIADIHATVLKALSIDYQQELQTPIGRPMAISKGTPIAQLVG